MVRRLDKGVQTYLRRQSRGGELVLGPRHPLLFRGPQALFSQPGNLCAIFSPMADERANGAHLAARLIDARLALPIECRMILVLSDSDDQDQAHLLRRDFNLVVTSGDRALGAFLRNTADRGAAETQDRATKDVAMGRFGVALTTSQRVFREARTSFRKEAATLFPRTDRRARRDIFDSDSGLSDYAYRPRNRFDTEFGTVSFLEAKGRAGLSRQLRSAVDSHLLDAWKLDAGVPVPIASDTHVAAATHGLELFRVRENMLIAAAFAGVAVSPTTRSDVVEYAFRTAKMAKAEAYPEGGIF